VFSVVGINLSYGLDWKKLHEKADNMNLSNALADVRAESNSLDGLYVLGLVYLNLHKDKEAGEVFNKILTLDPKVSEAKWGMAEVLRRQHQPEKSEELLSDVLKTSPDFPASYITLAYIRYTQMNFNEAVRLANMVLGIGEKNVDKSNHVRAHLLYGGTKGMIAHYGGPLSKIVNGTSVLPSLRVAEKLQPDSAEVKFGLGSFYLLAPSLAGGDLEKAEEYFKKAIEIDPFFADAYVRLGQLYKIKGDNVRYNEYLKKALEIDPQNELALDISSGKCKFICPDKRQ
jgi:protein O-GlcNAc transferase